MTRGGRVASVDDDAARQDQRLGAGFPGNRPANPSFEEPHCNAFTKNAQAEWVAKQNMTILGPFGPVNIKVGQPVDDEMQERLDDLCNNVTGRQAYILCDHGTGTRGDPGKLPRHDEIGGINAPDDFARCGSLSLYGASATSRLPHKRIHSGVRTLGHGACLGRQCEGETRGGCA